MKVAKIRKKEEKIVETSENYSIKNLIKIVVLLTVIFGAFYGVTLFLIKNKTKVAGEDSVAVVDSSKITMSQLLNRSEEEYYVLATKASEYESTYVSTNYISIYSSYINEYKQKEGSLTFYYVDLDSALNKNYVGTSLNIVDDLSKLKLTNEVLFKIKNGSIEKYYLGKDNIIDKLSRL